MQFSRVLVGNSCFTYFLQFTPQTYVAIKNNIYEGYGKVVPTNPLLNCTQLTLVRMPQYVFSWCGQNKKEQWTQIDLLNTCAFKEKLPPKHYRSK